MTYSPGPGWSEEQRPADSGRGLALTSMVLGIASLPLLLCFGLGVVPAIVAVVLGHIALPKTRRVDDQGARKQAVTGLVTGYVAIGLAILFGLFGLIGNVFS